MLLIRIRLPRRPGSLGIVASALGAIGADINLVEIVEKRGDVEFDEFILDLPPSRSVESLVATCDSLDEVQVEWVRNYPRGGGLEYDVDLHRRMTADSPHAGQILVSAAPLVFRADWSMLLEASATPRILERSRDAPDLGADALRGLQPFDVTHRGVVTADPGRGWDADHAMVAPMGEDRAIVIARRGEPAFFTSELARLAYLTDAESIDVSDEPSSSISHPASAHRRPVTIPLYQRRHS
ncbi:MAG TPA: amino acid-binding protein [Microlunatus sp.]|nr:amino acid-binding protein [Microlunatus sp.]